FLPDLKPHYPGYIAWRCLVDENDLSAQTHATLFGRYAVCVTPGEQGIGYAVPGPDQSMAAGKRQYNVVWYHPVPEADLARMMTDDSGRHHANGIAPGLISASVRQEMTEIAKRTLAPQFGEAIERAKLVFFQPILDLESPRLAFGRVVIIGDAAFVARPHVAMGVPKAASDVLALVQALERSGNKVTGLQSFEAERLRIGAAIVARGKYLGAYMESQLQPENIRRHAEALRVAEQVMMETAAPMNYN
ncbi:MAG: FAD-dependent monooxygenase, partial [Betaproteobacteria bacterium]